MPKKARYKNKKGKSKKIKPLKKKKNWSQKVQEKDFHKWYKKKGWNYGDRFVRNGKTYRYFYKKIGK